jgi:class 3 adenylate cyclase
MDPPGLKRRLTCILATDAVGYSRLVSEDEETALRVLAAHRAVIDGIIAFHDGRIISTAGDSVLAEFHSVVDAVRCAVEIQDALKTRNESLPEQQRMLFRIGINLGEVVVKGDDLLGDGVNVAARLESAAQPGGILISSSVYDQITGKLDLGFQDMGEQTLKNISRPIRAFRVSGAGGTIRAEPAPRAVGAAIPNRGMPSGTMPIVIGAIALAAVAGGIAWMQGWIGGPRPAEVRLAAPDPAKAKLEADLAASEKARAEAEQRARTADSDAVKARAEAEAAALRAKAESDAAALKAKAQAEAAAMRSQATQAEEASRAKAAAADAVKARAEAEAMALKAKAESEAAALRVKAEADTATAKARAEAEIAAAQSQAAREAGATKAATPPAGADASRYDGVWVATQKCSAVGRDPPFTRSANIIVQGGEFAVERGVPGEPGFNTARGRVAPDGTLVMTGNGISPGQTSYGRRFDIRYEGRWTGDRFVLHGIFGGRSCEVEITRAGAASEPRGKARR